MMPPPLPFVRKPCAAKTRRHADFESEHHHGEVNAPCSPRTNHVEFGRVFAAPMEVILDSLGESE
jgi:hypothetical protein